MLADLLRAMRPKITAWGLATEAELDALDTAARRHLAAPAPWPCPSPASWRGRAHGRPHWLGIWPTAEENPCHAGLKLCMAVWGHRIVDKPGSSFDSCED